MIQNYKTTRVIQQIRLVGTIIDKPASTLKFTRRLFGIFNISIINKPT